MNFLFVCSKNKWRSRTAETIFKNNGKHPVKSAGTEKSARIKLNQQLINWADVIFLMEQKHQVKMYKNFTVDDTTKEIVLLEIPDEYPYMDEELIDLLKIHVTPYFEAT